MAEESQERIIIVPLRKLADIPRTQRAKRAVKLVRSHIARHMKVDEENVWIDNPVNEALWARGREKPPNKLRVKATLFREEGDEEEVVEVTIPEE